MTALGNIYAGSRILAADVRGVAPLAAIKGSDQSVTSSTTLVNDTALLLPVVANAAYLFECFLDYEGGTGGSSDLKWGWLVPSGATLRYQGLYEGTSGTSYFDSNTESAIPAAQSAGAAVLKGVGMHGTFLTGSTAGTLQLQWAQNTSSATATIVHAQSFLALWQVQ